MKIFSFVISLVVTIGMVFLLNNPIQSGSTSIPAVGKLLNPFSGFWQNAEKVGDYKSEELDLPQLNAPVTVVYDDRLVPHVFAESIEDASFVQGYVTAQHRLWQMDISTRATSGRLAEILGPRLIKRDKVQRRKGILESAEKAAKEWEKNFEKDKSLSAYTDGVNAWVAQLSPKDYPIEYKLLGYKPEPWTTLKSAVFVRSMAESLCSREDDLESSNALKALGRETFDFLFPEYNPKQSPIVPEGTEWDFQRPVEEDGALQLSSTDYIPERPWKKPSPFLGSNNWAVAASKTANGNPILCSDPHLNLTLPSIWYEMQIHTPESNSYGATLPGMTGVIIGFNENIAWGETNVGHDVMDWFKIKWTDDKKDTYLLDGKETKVTWRVEEIKVKGGEIILDTVKYTVWGPIVHDDPGSVYQDMAMRWLPNVQYSSDEPATFMEMNKAKNYEDYSDALKNYIAPAQNFVFAAKDGDIAIKANGRLPVKRKEQGRFVQDGSDSKNNWQGMIPMDQIPQVKNPERGFVSSANQHSTTPDYPYYYNGGFEDYRGRILNRELEGMDKVTVEDMMKLQNSNYSLKAEEVMPLFLNAMKESGQDEKESSMLKTMREWDYNYSANDAAPSFFNMWFDAFNKMTWDEIYALEDKGVMLYPESWRTIELLESDPENAFFDDKSTPEVEVAKDMVQKSFEAMLKKVDELGGSEESLKWADQRDLVVGHLGQISAFSSERIISGGFGDALNASGSKAGPSWRMVVELGDEVNAYAVYPGGQSGNPGSPFFKNMLEKWTKGEYYKLHFAKSPEDLKDVTLFQQKFK